VAVQVGSSVGVCVGSVGSVVAIESVGLAVGRTVGLAVGRAVGRTVGFAVGRTVGFAVGLALAFGVALGLGLALAFGLGLAVGLALGLGLGLAVGLGQSIAGRLRPAVQCTAAAYGARISAAGTWLVVKAFSDIPGKAKPPSAPWPERRCVNTVFEACCQLAPSGSCPAATSAWRTTASESGSLAGGPQTEAF
jgi:hypothetical protein